ncbi:MAG: hypothetical protein ACREQV_12025, partial [Candidatus Binatia bacterium]
MAVLSEYDERLAQLLAERGLLKPEQLQHVRGRAENEGRNIQDVIQEERLIYPEALTHVKSEVIGVPYVDLTKVKINPEAMRDVARKAAVTYRFVAFDAKNGKLQLAME